MQDIAAATAEAQSVRKAGPSDLNPMAKVLARAFNDDPHACWILLDDATRKRRLERGYALGLRRLWLPQDECYTTVGVVGAAIWMRPGQTRVTKKQQLSLLPAMVHAYGREFFRVARLLAYLDSIHPHEPDHWYLAFVGVDPDWQGRGLGSALIQPVLERCDREGTPAYLEASTERSRALYERNGFEVMMEYRLWDEGPLGWQMWRKPRPAG
jgi:ribosomal protein S18 acetylase RimI-like enzyme